MILTCHSPVEKLNKCNNLSDKPGVHKMTKGRPPVVKKPKVKPKLSAERIEIERVRDELRIMRASLIEKYQPQLKEFLEKKKREIEEAKQSKDYSPLFNAARKLYLLKNIDGREILTETLIDWCRENNYGYSLASAQATGKKLNWSSGWHCVIIK